MTAWQSRIMARARLALLAVSVVALAVVLVVVQPWHQQTTTVTIAPPGPQSKVGFTAPPQAYALTTPKAILTIFDTTDRAERAVIISRLNGAIIFEQRLDRPGDATVEVANNRIRELQQGRTLWIATSRGCYFSSPAEAHPAPQLATDAVPATADLDYVIHRRATNTIVVWRLAASSLPPTDRLHGSFTTDHQGRIFHATSTLGRQVTQVSFSYPAQVSIPARVSPICPSS